MSASVAGMPEAARAPEHQLLAVTKADARSPVYRRAWLDLVAVTLPDGEGKGVRQYRFVGLFPSAATTSSVLDVPLVRRRVEAVIARSGVPADSHTGKELLEVLETYPRDELLQVGPDELLPVALAVLHLQERRQTRLFLRRDPTGRFWSALVYLPRDRYTTEVRTRMQQILLERLGGTSVEYTARSTESVLARLHFVVRVPVGRRGSPKPASVDHDALQAELAAAARSWTDDLSDELTARYGVEAERMLVPGGRRLPGLVPERLHRRAGRRRPGAAGQPRRGRAVAAPVDAVRLGDGGTPADGVPRGGAADALRGAAAAAEHGRLRRRRAALRDRPDRRPAHLDLRLRHRRPRRRAAPPALAARALHRRRRRGVAGGGRGRRAGRAGPARRAQLAPGDRRPRLRAVAAAGGPALRAEVRGGDPRRRTRTSSPGSWRCSRRGSPRAAAAAGPSGRPTWSSRCGGRSARSSRWTPTACSPRCWPRSPPPSAPPTTRPSP